MRCRMLALPVACALAIPLASPVDAAMISRIYDHDVCSLMSTIGHEAAVMRQSGVSQQSAANRMGGLIGNALSNGSGSQAQRQRTANLVAGEATNILRLIYSTPVGRNNAERVAYVQAAEEYIYDYCMGRAN